MLSELALSSSSAQSLAAAPPFITHGDAGDVIPAMLACRFPAP
ncbi:hypothetical protein [Nocardia cyriacigeorgica]|nr:hypothetical protein [Nocardia cyriacigeorgica]